jgi:glutamine amidotransferase
MFGFRSVLQSQVHRSLVSADNAIAVQSEDHPDGWGVAYYNAGAPHIIKSAGLAVGDKLFHRVSGIVTSQTVLAHIRKATQGELNTLNCHPFQYGRWVLAHNGDIPDFSRLRPELVSRVSPLFRRFILGDTDSEVVFHIFLSLLAGEVELQRKGTPLEAVVRALRETVAIVRDVADAGGTGERALLTLLLTDGELMVAHQGGKELHFSTYKANCPEQGDCPFYAPECEAPSETGYVNHFIVSSEPLQGENVWLPLEEGEIVAVDHAMRFHRFARS